MGNPTKTCIICLETYDIKESRFIKLSSTSPDSETYMNQMQYALNIDFVFDDTSEICMYCLEDVKKVYQFRKKFDVAVEYWKIYDSKLKTQNVSKTNFKQEAEDSDDGGNIEEYSCEKSVKIEDEIEFIATFACGRCQLLFNSAAKLVSHQCRKPNNTVKQKKQTEIDLVQEPIEISCKICDRTFDQQSKLSKHLTRVHGSKQHKCSSCEKTFTNSFNLREHEASHSGIMNYNCEICGKLFQRLSSQRRHLRIHQGKKPRSTPFLCNICGKSFPVSNGMQRHMRTHIGDRRHVCKICGKRFMQSTHLKVHLRTHTGEKPYSCPVCHTSFTLPATLRKHLKVHEREGVSFVKKDCGIGESEEVLQQSGNTELVVETMVTFG